MQNPPEILKKNTTYLNPNETDNYKRQIIDSILDDSKELNVIIDRNYDSEFLRLLQDETDLTILKSKPEPLNKKQIIRDAHDSELGGHYALDKTLAKIKKFYDWHNMTHEVKDYIDTCETCQRNKETKRQTYRPQATDIPNKPNEKISIDIIGPLEPTPSENKYILVIQDYLTRYLMCEPH